MSPSVGNPSKTDGHKVDCTKQANEHKLPTTPELSSLKLVIRCNLRYLEDNSETKLEMATSIVINTYLASKIEKARLKAGCSVFFEIKNTIEVVYLLLKIYVMILKTFCTHF